MRKRVALGGAIKAVREARALQAPAEGFDPEQFRLGRFALKCQMTPGHLCNIEAGRKFPPEDVIHRIAALLGVPADAISYELPMEALNARADAA
jgi:hypothetical protein